MSTCGQYTNENACIHAEGHYSDDTTSYSYSLYCLWCIGYQNVTDIAKCINDFDYCDDKALCQSYKVDGELDCDRAANMATAIILCIAICVVIGACWYLSQFNLCSSIATLREKICGTICCVITFVFLTISIWLAITRSPIAAILWEMFVTVFLFIPWIGFVLLFLYPVLIVLRKPLKSAFLANLLFIIAAVFVMSIGYAIYEMVMVFITGSGVFTAIWSIIMLEVDWVLLAIEHQTVESLEEFNKHWHRIKCHSHSIDRNMVNNPNNQSEYDEFEEAESEPKHASNPLSSNVMSASNIDVDHASNASTSGIPLLSPSWDINVVGGVAVADRRQLLPEQHRDMPHPAVLVGELLLYALWMIGFIIWTILDDEEKEACAMNIATVIPALFSICKRIYPYFTHAKDWKCLIILSAAITFSLYLFFFMIWACVCNHKCFKWHIIVVIAVILYAGISTFHHVTKLRMRLRQRLKANAAAIN